MKTTIKSMGKYWIAETIRPIPLNPDKTVNYDEYVTRIKQSYPVKVDRDLTEVF